VSAFAVAVPREAGASRLIDRLFDRFDQHLNAKGYIARGGQMVDASIVPVPKQRNRRDENEAIQRGETPTDWKEEARQELLRLQGRSAFIVPRTAGNWA
jgi:hypothetical protein